MSRIRLYKTTQLCMHLKVRLEPKIELRHYYNFNETAELFNTIRYGREYVIGRNCRFLQGPETSKTAVRRLKDAITAGEEICETVLNYRRDVSPFVNLLMIAPL